jgi:hypothetical protein
MFVARITPQTALQTARQIAVEFDRCLREIGELASALVYSGDLERLRQHSDEQWIDIDIAVYDWELHSDQPWIGWLQKGLPSISPGLNSDRLETPRRSLVPVPPANQ